MEHELPRQKQQVNLKKMFPNAVFETHDLMGTRTKIVLIVPHMYRDFIYQEINKSHIEGQEQLATDFLFRFQNGKL